MLGFIFGFIFGAVVGVALISILQVSKDAEEHLRKVNEERGPIRLIDAEALITKLVNEDYKTHRYCFPCREILKAIKEAPTVEEKENEDGKNQ